ncbi:hypothetical protein LCER1_G002780 [Lachnellula cervina]|uniref:Uncharacterized protein n=1 Tax=Lachnellula cervina TaxID=1316786 RepID=A0A7D8UQ94_9HELO|nr:hypothetical protein LCER1_G002780 [Lachnellula cervina]
MQLNSVISTFLLLCLPFALAQDPAAAAAAAPAAAAPAAAAPAAAAPAAAAPVAAGVAAGGGVAATSAATQYPTATTAAKLISSNGETSTTYVLFIQTFATTALGSWDLGPSPSPGSIGLGSISGEVGAVKTQS